MNSLKPKNAEETVEPHLRALAQHRAEHQQATADEQVADEKVGATAQELERLVALEVEQRRLVESAHARHQQTEKDLAIAEDRHTTALKLQQRFADTSSQPICSLCHQPIDATHVTTERAKLHRDVHAGAQAIETYRGAVDQAAQQCKAAQDRFQQIQDERDAAQKQANDAIAAQKDARRRLSDARRAFDRATGYLGSTFAQRVAPIAEAGFPMADDVRQIQTVAQALSGRTRQRQDLCRGVADRWPCGAPLNLAGRREPRAPRTARFPP